MTDQPLPLPPGTVLDPGPSTLPTGRVKNAVCALGRAILGGRFPSGSTLPVEADLCAELGLTRTTLREAIKVLAGKGLVRTARRYGTKVCGHAEWNLLDADVVGWLPADDPLTRWFMFDLTELRRVVEPEAAARAAERATEAEVAELQRLALAIDAPDTADVLRADVAFHGCLLRASHNIIIAQLARPWTALLTGYFKIGTEQIGDYTNNPAQHQRIAALIAARDPAGAAAETLALLESNRQQALLLTAGWGPHP